MSENHEGKNAGRLAMQLLKLHLQSWAAPVGRCFWLSSGNISMVYYIYSYMFILYNVLNGWNLHKSSCNITDLCCFEWLFSSCEVQYSEIVVIHISGWMMGWFSRVCKLLKYKTYDNIWIHIMEVSWNGDTPSYHPFRWFFHEINYPIYAAIIGSWVPYLWNPPTSGRTKNPARKDIRQMLPRKRRVLLYWWEAWISGLDQIGMLRCVAASMRTTPLKASKIDSLCQIKLICIS